MMLRRPPSSGLWHRSRGCGATINSERTPEISRSVSVSKSHRQETRTDLPPGEPAAEPESAREPRVQPGKKWPAKRLWKRRSLRELGNPFGIPTFPQPQQQQALSGYISNGSTGIARVTFLDGLTGPFPCLLGSMTLRLRELIDAPSVGCDHEASFSFRACWRGTSLHTGVLRSEQ